MKTKEEYGTPITIDELALHYSYHKISIDDFKSLLYEYAEQFKLEILDKYTNFLIKENYADIDVITEEPTAIDQFLFINKNK